MALDQKKNANGANGEKAAKKQAAKPAIVAPPAPPEGASAQLMLKVKDLVDRVASETDNKRNVVKEIVEATLAVLGKALDAGEVLNLPPIGKIRVAKAVAEGGSGAMTLKIRKSSGAKSENGAAETKTTKAKGKAKQALAEVSD